MTITNLNDVPVQEVPAEEVFDENLYYLSREGDIPFWDHPLMYGYPKLPKHYYPYTTKAEVLQAYKRSKIKEQDFMILKVLGDAIAANEDQLRRYLSSQMSRSEVSKRLDLLRRNGFVDRWHCRLENDETEEFRPPAPFTLGVAGFKLMKHFYSDCPFMNPDSWDKTNAKAIQRYVAMNELRCALVESKTIKGWQWNAVIGNHRRFRTPMGVANIETPKGQVNFVIERPQMSQNFIGYLKETLKQWTSIFDNYGTFPIQKAPENSPVVVIYASTVSLAEHIHNSLMLDQYPFQVWLCIEEYMEKDGLKKAFMTPKGETLQRIKLPFLEKICD